MNKNILKNGSPKPSELKPCFKWIETVFFTKLKCFISVWLCVSFAKLYLIMAREVAMMSGIALFLKSWKLFWLFSKMNFSRSWKVGAKKFPIQQASTASWKILVGKTRSVVGLCALSHQKLLRWWGELKIYLPRTDYQRSQELHLAEACLPTPVVTFSCWQLWERFYFRGRVNSPVSQSLQLPRACLLPAETQLNQRCCWIECLQPQRLGLRLKPMSKTYFCFFFFQVNPYLWRIGLVSSNPLVLHERWMDGRDR